MNVGLCQDDDALQAQFGGLAELVRPGVLIGSPEQLVDRIGAYVDAGADQINIAMRAPWDVSSSTSPRRRSPSSGRRPDRKFRVCTDAFGSDLVHDEVPSHQPGRGPAARSPPPGLSQAGI